MIPRLTFPRVPTTNWINSLSKHGHQQKRLASVSSRIFQSQPERPPRTDFLEKYQEKLERKAKESSPPMPLCADKSGREFQVFQT